MKIVAYKAGGDYCCRPDTTLNHNNSDYWCPEGVSLLKAVPTVYTHIDKAGKCVAERFARRYFKTVAFGCLLTDASGGVSEAIATSMDFTSIMDMGWMDNPAQTTLKFEVNGNEIFSAAGKDYSEDFARAIVDITRRSTLRIGDIIALELGEGCTVKPGDTITMTAGEKTVPIKIY
ncbi:MAG: hypothetical protein IKX71_04375 [Bacteroidales bacterium]|nr:hypothetical protein [Bacteroidales bacterium]